MHFAFATHSQPSTWNFKNESSVRPTKNAAFCFAHEPSKKCSAKYISQSIPANTKHIPTAAVIYSSNVHNKSNAEQ